MATPETDWILPQIDLRRCTGCGLCAELCPTHAVEVRGGRAEIVDPAACSFCDVCETYCPEGAIMRPFTIRFATYVVDGEASPPQDSDLSAYVVEEFGEASPPQDFHPPAYAVEGFGEAKPPQDFESTA